MTDSIDALVKEIDKDHKNTGRYQEFGKRLLALTKEGRPWETKEKARYVMSYFLDVMASSVKKDDREVLETVCPFVTRVLHNGKMLKEALAGKAIPQAVDFGLTVLDRPILVHNVMRLLIYLLDVPKEFEGYDKLIKKGEKLSGDGISKLMDIVDNYSALLSRQALLDDKNLQVNAKSVEIALRILTRLIEFPKCLEIIEFSSFSLIVERLSIEKLINILLVTDCSLTTVVCKYIATAFPIIHDTQTINLRQQMFEDQSVLFFQLLNNSLEETKDEARKERKLATRKVMSLLLNEERGYELMRKMFPQPLLEFLEVGIGFSLSSPPKLARFHMTKQELMDLLPQAKGWNKQAVGALSESLIMKQPHHLNFELFWDMVEKDFNTSRFRWSRRNLDEICGIIQSEIKYVSATRRRLVLLDVPFLSIRSNSADDGSDQVDDKMIVLTTTNKNLDVMGYRMLALFMELKLQEAMRKEGSQSISYPGPELPVPINGHSGNNQTGVVCKGFVDPDWLGEARRGKDLYLPNVGKVAVPILSYIYNIVEESNMEINEGEAGSSAGSTGILLDEHLKLLNLLAIHKPISITTDTFFHFISLILQRCGKILSEHLEGKEGESGNKLNFNHIDKIVMGLIPAIRSLAVCKPIGKFVCESVLKYGIQSQLIGFIRNKLSLDINTKSAGTPGEGSGTDYETQLDAMSCVFALFKIILDTKHRDTYPLIMPDVYMVLSKYVIRMFMTKLHSFNSDKQMNEYCMDSTTMKFVNTFICLVLTLDDFTLSSRFHFTSGLLELFVLILLLQKTFIHKWDIISKGPSSSVRASVTAEGSKSIAAKAPSTSTPRGSVLASRPSTAGPNGEGSTNQQSDKQEPQNPPPTKGSERKSVLSEEQHKTLQEFDVFKRGVVDFLAKTHDIQDICSSSESSHKSTVARSYLEPYLPSSVIAKLSEIKAISTKQRQTVKDSDLAALLTLVHTDVLSPQLIYSEMYRCNTLRCLIAYFDSWLKYGTDESGATVCAETSFLEFVKRNQNHKHSVTKGKKTYPFVTQKDVAVLPYISYPLVEVVWGGTDGKDSLGSDGRNSFVVVDGVRYNEIGGVFVELYLKQQDASLRAPEVFYSEMIRWLVSNQKDVSTICSGGKPEDREGIQHISEEKDLLALVELYTVVLRCLDSLLARFPQLFKQQNISELPNVFVVLKPNVGETEAAKLGVEIVELSLALANGMSKRVTEIKLLDPVLESALVSIKATIDSGACPFAKYGPIRRILKLFSKWLAFKVRKAVKLLDFVHELNNNPKLYNAAKLEVLAIRREALSTAKIEAGDNESALSLLNSMAIIHIVDALLVGPVGDAEESTRANGAEDQKEQPDAKKPKEGKATQQEGQADKAEGSPATVSSSGGKQNTLAQAQEKQLLQQISKVAADVLLQLREIPLEALATKTSQATPRKGTKASASQEEPAKPSTTMFDLQTIFPLGLLRQAKNADDLSRAVCEGRAFVSPFAIWDPSMTKELSAAVSKALSTYTPHISDTAQGPPPPQINIHYSIFTREPVIAKVVVRGFVQLDNRALQDPSIVQAVGEDFMSQALDVTVQELKTRRFRDAGNADADVMLYTALVKSLEVTKNSEPQVAKEALLDSLFRLALGDPTTDKDSKDNKDSNRYTPLVVAHLHRLFTFLLPADSTIKTAPSSTQNVAASLSSKAAVILFSLLTPSTAQLNDFPSAVVARSPGWRFGLVLPVLSLLLSRFEFAKIYLSSRLFLHVILIFLHLVRGLMNGGAPALEKQAEELFALYVSHFAHLLAVAPKKKVVQKALGALISSNFAETIAGIKVSTPDMFEIPLGLGAGRTGGQAAVAAPFVEVAKTVFPLMTKPETLLPLYFFSHEMVEESAAFAEPLVSGVWGEVERVLRGEKGEKGATSSTASPAQPTSSISASSFLDDQWEAAVLAHSSKVYARELNVGGVFVRAFLKQPHTKDVDPKTFLDALCKELCAMAKRDARSSSKGAKDQDTMGATQNTLIGLMLGCVGRILEFHIELTRRPALIDLAGALIGLLTPQALRHLEGYKQQGISVRSSQVMHEEVAAPVTVEAVAQISRILSAPEALAIFKKADITQGLVALLVDPALPGKEREALVGVAKALCINGKVVAALDSVVRDGLPVALSCLLLSADEGHARSASEALSALAFNCPKCSALLESCLPLSVVAKIEHDADEVLAAVADLDEGERMSWADACLAEALLIARDECDSKSSDVTRWQPTRVKELAEKLIGALKTEGKKEDEGEKEKEGEVDNEDKTS